VSAGFLVGYAAWKLSFPPWRVAVTIVTEVDAAVGLVVSVVLAVFYQKAYYVFLLDLVLAISSALLVGPNLDDGVAHEVAGVCKETFLVPAPDDGTTSGPAFMEFVSPFAKLRCELDKTALIFICIAVLAWFVSAVLGAVIWYLERKERRHQPRVIQATPMYAHRKSLTMFSVRPERTSIMDLDE